MTTGINEQTVTLRQIAEKANIAKRTVERRALRESWSTCGTIIVNHNETKIYNVSDLPLDIQQYFNTNSALSPLACPAPALTQGQGILPVPVIAPKSVVTAERRIPDSTTELKDWQRDVMTARLAIIGAVDNIVETENITINRAIERFLEQLLGGLVEQEILEMVDRANNRKGDSRGLAKGTIYRWIQDRKKYGNLGLAPADKEDMSVPVWAREFLAIYRLPSKPTIPMILEKMGNNAPSYSQASRFLKKFSRVDAQRGRMSGSELRSIRGYTRRDKSNLMPLDVVIADGHSFKAKVSHPVHGKPFHPEMEGIIDAATRVCIGWSVGLAESSHVVADALRHAVTVNEKKLFGGVPAIFYSDQGSGNKAKAISHIEMGILARIGTQFKTGIAGNPQGRGIVEKMQGSLWVRSAKELLTYTGKDMDSLAQRRIMKIVNKDIQEKGTSEQLITWSRFIDFAQRQVDAYNARPHSALPKISDPVMGRRRFMSPAEVWSSFVADGWKPTVLSNDEIMDLFRPQIQVKVRRAQVTVFGNIYYHKTLEHFHGEDVIACYDIHDPKIVWVRDLKQRLICEAVWDANKRDYFPVSVIEQARQKRMERRLKRIEDQAYEIKQERRGVIGAVIAQEDPIIADMASEEPTPEPELIMTEYDIDDRKAM